MGALRLLGAPGFLFLIVITVSMQFLAKSRFTRRVFHSDLTINPQLTPEKITQLIEELKS